MTDICNTEGEVIADIPLSSKQLGLLEGGNEITVIFHTPQLLHKLLGQRSGSFSLHKADGHIVTKEPEAVTTYADLQKAVVAARGT